MKLILGVVDLPYQTMVPQEQRRVAVRRRKGGKPQRVSAALAGGQTTGDVAEILEDRYHVMETFVELHGQEIADAMAESMGDALNDLLAGAPPGNNATAAAMGLIQAMFVEFIDTKEMDGLQPGVPTAASLAGVNHRFKHPYARGNPVRPSFKDTGAYEGAFVAWTE